MDLQEQLTLPLWRLLWRALVRLLTFASSTDRWSHLSSSERAERRARWPAWRRAVRPVGLGVFWFAAIWSVAVGDRSGSLTTALRFGWFLLLVPIACLGIRDWWRDVPSKRRGAASAAGNRDAASPGASS